MAFAKLAGNSRGYGFNAREKSEPECKLGVDQLDKWRAMCRRDMGVRRDALKCCDPPRGEQRLERMFYERIEQIEQLETFNQFEGVVPEAVLEAEPKGGTDALIIVV